MATQQIKDHDVQASQAADPAAKRRRTNISSTTQSTDETTKVTKQLVIGPKEPTVIVTATTLDPNRPIVQGQQSRFSEDEVLTF